MYLHIGNDLAIPFSEVVLILNYDTVKFSKKEEIVAKSVIIAGDGKKTDAYYSDISSKALLNRFESFFKGERKNVIGI